MDKIEFPVLIRKVTGSIWQKEAEKKSPAILSNLQIGSDGKISFWEAKKQDDIDLIAASITCGLESFSSNLTLIRISRRVLEGISGVVIKSSPGDSKIEEAKSLHVDLSFSIFDAYNDFAKTICDQHKTIELTKQTTVSLVDNLLTSGKLSISALNPQMRYSPELDSFIKHLKEQEKPVTLQILKKDLSKVSIPIENLPENARLIYETEDKWHIVEKKEKNTVASIHRNQLDLFMSTLSELTKKKTAG